MARARVWAIKVESPQKERAQSHEAKGPLLMPTPFEPPGSDKTYEEQLADLAKIHKLQHDGFEHRLDMMLVLEDTLTNYRSKTGEMVKDEPS